MYRVLMFVLVLLGLAVQPAEAGEIYSAAFPGKCVAVDSGFPLTRPIEPVTAVLAEDCDTGNPAKTWEVENFGPDFFFRANVERSGYSVCLALPNGEIVVNKHMVATFCNQTAPQLWTLEFLPNSRDVLIKAVMGDGTEYCLAVQSGLGNSLMVALQICKSGYAPQFFFFG